MNPTDKPAKRGRKAIPEDRQRVTKSFQKWIDHPTNQHCLSELIADLMHYELRQRLKLETNN